jgi:hypothetical protein
MPLQVKSPLMYLLGSEKILLLKLFIRNRDQVFSIQHIEEKTHIPLAHIKNELKQAVKYGVIQEIKQDKQILYSINALDEILALESVIFRFGDDFFDKLSQKLDKVGTMSFVAVMGVFLQRENDRVDLFLVADDLNEKKFDNCIEEIEVELAQEIRYTVLSTQEFQYRQNMFDKFVLDILENKNTRILIDKLSISGDNR